MDYKRIALLLEDQLKLAAILAAKENRVYIQQSDIRHAFVKVGIGPEKKSRIVSEKERRITAYHEAGHSILFHLLPEAASYIRRLHLSE